MDANTVSLIIAGVVGFMLLLGVLWGIKRGLKKSLFRLIWLLVTAVILFFVTPLISEPINEIDLSSLNLNIFGNVTKLSDVGVNIFTNLIGSEQLESNPELLNFVQSLSTVILNIVLFVLLFWVLKVLLWFVWAPIAHKCFDKKLIEKKKFKKEQKKKLKKSKGIDTPQDDIPLLLSVKENKHRGWGALVGLLIGLVVVACTFMPIIGVNNIYQNVYANVLYEEDGEEKPYLNQVLNEEIRGYVNSYENSIANKILTYSGVSLVSNYVFNNMAAVKVGNEKIYFESLVDKGVKIYNKVLVINKFDIDNITKENLSDVIDAVKYVISEVKDLKGVYVLADSVAPNIIKDFVNEADFNFDNEQLEQIIKNVVNNPNTNLTLTNLQTQVELVLNIIKELNNKDLIAPIINTQDLTVDFIGNLVSSNIINLDVFVDNIFENFNNIDLLENEYPRLMDTGFEMLFETLDVEYIKQTSESDEFSKAKIDNIKLGFKTIFKNALKFLKLYVNSVDLDFDATTSTENVNTSNDSLDSFNTREAINCVGEVLNVVRVKPESPEEEKLNFLSETNYENLIEYLQLKLTDLTEGTIDVSSLINSLALVDNWKNELNNFPVLYRAIIQIINSGEDFETLKSEENLLLNKVGLGLKTAVDTSVIVNNQNLRSVMENILNNEEYISSIKDVLDVVVENGLTVKDFILNNIYNTSSSAMIKSNVGSNWDQEIYLIKKILNANFNNFELADMGSVLDDISSSKIFTKEVISSIVVDAINNITNDVFENPMPTNLNSAIVELKNNIKDNSSSASFSYDREFEFLQGLFDVLEASYENDSEKNLTAEEVMLLSIGHQFDEISGSSLVLTSNVLNNLLAYYYDDYISDLTGIDSNVLTTINKVKNNFSLIESYEVEFENILNLAKVIDSSTATLEDVGEQLDIIKENSKIITSEIITELINYYVDDKTNAYLTNYSVVINKIKTKIGGAYSYKTMFRELLTITNNLSSYDAISTSNIEDAGAFLDSMANMTTVSDKQIAKDVANIFINRVKNDNAGLESAIDQILSDNDFNNYVENTNTSNYFANLFAEIKNAL